MQLVEFNPENELEWAIQEAKSRKLPFDELVKIIVRSNLYVSSKGVVQQDGNGFDPLLLEQNGRPLVAVFSSLSRPSLHGHMAQFVLQMIGRKFFLRLPPSYGIILNPGYVGQLIIPSDGIAVLKKDLEPPDD